MRKLATMSALATLLIASPVLAQEQRIRASASPEIAGPGDPVGITVECFYPSGSDLLETTLTFEGVPVSLTDLGETSDGSLITRTQVGTVTAPQTAGRYRPEATCSYLPPPGTGPTVDSFATASFVVQELVSTEPPPEPTEPTDPPGTNTSVAVPPIETPPAVVSPDRPSTFDTGADPSSGSDPTLPATGSSGPRPIAWLAGLSFSAGLTLIARARRARPTG